MTDALVTRFEQLIVENVKLKDDADDLRTQNEELRHELRDIKQELNEKRQRIFTLEELKDQNQTELQARSDIIEEMDRQVGKLQEELSAARFDLMAAGGKPTGNF